MASTHTPYYYNDLPAMPSIKVGSENDVLIAFVQGRMNISVHPLRFRSTLDSVCDRCDTLGSLDGAVPMAEEDIKVGVLCNSKYEDGNWYRSLIKSVDYVQKTALLFFVDYGNSDYVGFASILPMDVSLLMYPIQALSVQPGNSAFTEEELESFCADVTVLNMKITKRLGNGIDDPEAGSPTHEVIMTLTAEPILKCSSEDDLDGACKEKAEEKSEKLVDLPKVPLVALEIVAPVNAPEEKTEKFVDLPKVTVAPPKLIAAVDAPVTPCVEKTNHNEGEALNDSVPKEAFAADYEQFKNEMQKFSVEMRKFAGETLSSRNNDKKEFGLLKECFATFGRKFEQLELKQESTASSVRKLEACMELISRNLENLTSENFRMEMEGLLVPMRHEIRALEKSVASVGTLKQQVATLAGKLESETLSVRKDMAEINSNKSKQEDLVPLLLSSLRCKDELVDRMLKEKVEEKERTDKAINELKVKIAMRAITHT